MNKNKLLVDGLLGQGANSRGKFARGLHRREAYADMKGDIK